MDTTGEPAKYTDLALHFEVEELPRLLLRCLPDTGRGISFADIGCGDGPLFAALVAGGHIDQSHPVYAVDLETARLARVVARFPWITTITGPADRVPEIEDRSLDIVCSTMVLEHVPDERRFLDEIHRILRPGGRAFITTVYKHPRAWYFRKRDGVSVLDTSHLREYTDLPAFRRLVEREGRFEVLELERERLWFPLLDPLLFRLGGRFPNLAAHPGLLRFLRAVKVPIVGYYALSVILQRPDFPG